MKLLKLAFTDGYEIILEKKTFWKNFFDFLRIFFQIVIRIFYLINKINIFMREQPF